MLKTCDRAGHACLSGGANVSARIQASSGSLPSGQESTLEVDDMGDPGTYVIDLEAIEPMECKLIVRIHAEWQAAEELPPILSRSSRCQRMSRGPPPPKPAFAAATPKTSPPKAKAEPATAEKKRVRVDDSAAVEHADAADAREESAGDAAPDLGPRGPSERDLAKERAAQLKAEDEALKAEAAARLKAERDAANANRLAQKEARLEAAAAASSSARRRSRRRRRPTPRRASQGRGGGPRQGGQGEHQRGAAGGREGRGGRGGARARGERGGGAGDRGGQAEEQRLKAEAASLARRERRGGVGQGGGRARAHPGGGEDAAGAGGDGGSA